MLSCRKKQKIVLNQIIFLWLENIEARGVIFPEVDFAFSGFDIIFPR